MKKKTKWITAALAGALLAATALDSRLKVVRYALHSDKVESPLRLVVIADLHSCAYGENMAELIAATMAESPDAVLLCGDYYDDVHSPENARSFAAQIAQMFPTYYVTGNHEIATRRVDTIQAELTALGVTVLRGDAVPLTVHDETIWIGGADDPTVGETKACAERRSARAKIPAGAFSVLLSHRPELAEDYAALGFDLVVSGHAHGGQWRLPILLNGLYAPHQGLFPAYAGGAYALGGTTLIVSRGLARETTRVPRIFNRPELVLIEVGA